MKNDLQNFEENLKKKLEEYEFPFDEKNWEKARFMTDASRNNRKPFMFYFISALVVLTIGSGFVYFYNTSSSNLKPQNNLLAVNSNAVFVSENSSEPLPNNTINIENSTFNKETATNGNINMSPNDLNSIATTNSTEAKAKNTISKTVKVQTTTSNNTDLALSGSTSNSSPATTNVSSSSSGNQNSAGSDNVSGSNSNPNSNTTGTSNSSNSVKESVDNSIKKADKTKSSTVTEIPAVLGSNAVTNAPRNTTNITTSLNQNNNKLGNIITPIHNFSNSEESKAVSDTTSTDNGTQVTDSVGAVITLTSNTFIASSADSVNTPAAVKSDSASSSSSSPTNPIKIGETKSYIYADIGANYMLGWNHNGSQEANGFNITGGLNYQYYFNQIISLTAGAYYNSIGNLTQSTYSVANVKYDFGVQKDITSIKYIRLHYITVPVKVGFNIGKNNCIGVGANLSMLINSDSQKDKYKTQNSEQPNNTNRLSSSKETGYVTGFNPYDVQASVFYRRKLFKGFSVGAEFYYGFSDIKDNSHFKTTNTEKAMGAKLTIGYDLFKN